MTSAFGLHIHGDSSENNHKPLISVVIPVFNGIGYLYRTLETILHQDYPNIEIVLVDGGSSDGSLQYIKAFSCEALNVVMDSLPKGTPPEYTWTHACLLAHGEYIKVMGQDDILAQGSLSTQADLLGKNPSAGMITGPRNIIDRNDRLFFASKGLRGLQRGLNTGDSVLLACFLAGTNVIGEPFSVLFRRSSLIPLMPWSGKRPLLLDIEMYTRVLRHWHLYVDDKVVGNFRISSTSLSFRTARSHCQQFREWQDEFMRDHKSTSLFEQARGRLGVQMQTFLRSTAYLLMDRKV